MIKSLTTVLLFLVFIGCNPVTHTYSLMYTTEEPNEAFAMKLEEVLEAVYFKVDIQLRMELSKETIDEIRNRLRLIVAKNSQ